MALGKINIFANNWVDMVFSGRNQQYGAYVLRKESDKNTNKGILYAIVFFTLAVSAPVIINYIEGLVPKDAEEVKVTEVNTLEEPPPVDKDQPPPPPAEPPPPLKSTVKFVPPEIKPDEEVPDEPPPTQEDLKEKDAAVKTEEGDANGVDASLLESGDGVTGDTGPEIVTFAEQMPEFEGGQEEMMKYFSKNINYPPVARENGIEGKVILSFVVGTDGKISQIEVLKKLGWGLEEEAVRVVKSMPPWRPGKQNGKPVFVKFTLPVTFRLN
ncbi:MAG: TonB family protein [Bacteroidota bacterium]